MKEKKLDGKIERKIKKMGTGKWGILTSIASPGGRVRELCAAVRQSSALNAGADEGDPSWPGFILRTMNATLPVGPSVG